LWPRLGRTEEFVPVAVVGVMPFVIDAGDTLVTAQAWIFDPASGTLAPLTASTPTPAIASSSRSYAHRV